MSTAIPYNKSQKGNSLIYVLVGVLVLALIGGAYYLGTQKVQVKTTQETVVLPPLNPSPTPVSNMEKMPQIVTPTSVPAKKLSYSLPNSWKTSTDIGGNIEIGYDPSLVIASPLDKEINFGYVKCCGSYIISLGSYDGGSRHQTIYNNLGITDPKSSQTNGYYEKEYSYNGWNCLVMYGLAFSASGTTWGICPTSSSQAIYISGGPSDQVMIEQQLSSIKLLK